MTRTIRAGGLAVLLTPAALMLAVTGAANAQSASSTASQFTRGYNSGYSGMSTPVNASVRDANGNLTILDGVIQTGNDSSVFGKLNVSGALDQFAGAGGVSTTSGTGTATGTATAIGNNLVVVTSGSYNTVIVNANQTNNGTVTATTTVLNGKVNLND